MEPKCISFGGLAVDTAVVGQMLLVVRPAAVDAARLVATQEADRRQEVVKALSLEVEAARYAAALLHRQYDAVELPGLRGETRHRGAPLDLSARGGDDGEPPDRVLRVLPRHHHLVHLVHFLRRLT